MAKYNPNQALIDDANKATACGMSYGDWRSKGCPKPNGREMSRTGCNSGHYMFRNGCKRGRKKI